MLQLRDPNVEADEFWDTFVNATNDLGDDEESEGIKIEQNAQKMLKLEEKKVKQHFISFIID